MDPRAIFAVFKARIKIYARYPGFIVMSIVYPIFTTLLPVFLVISVGGSLEAAGKAFMMYSGTGDFIFFIIVGSTVWSISVGIIWDFGMWLYEEMEAGTLEQIFLTPISVWEMLIGSLMYTVVISLTTSMMSLVIVSMMFGYIHHILSIDFIVALLIIVLGFIPLMGMSLFFGALVLRIKEPWSFFNFLTAFLVFIAGVFYPISILPPIARVIAVLFPVTLQIADARAVLLNIEYVFDPAIDLIILTTYALFWPLFGFWMFTRIREEMHRRGTIGAY